MPKPIKGVIPVVSPSLDEVAMGTDFFVDNAVRIMKDVFPDVEFYPKPTEVEISIDDDMEKKEVATLKKKEDAEEKPAEEEKPAAEEKKEAVEEAASAPEEPKKDEEKTTE